MPVFELIVLSLLAGDVLWFVWVSRRLAGLRLAWLWRMLLTAFLVSQGAYIVQFFAREFWPQLPRRGNLPWFTGVYLWHLVLLPAITLPMLFRNAWRRWRNRRSRTQQPAASLNNPAFASGASTAAAPKLSRRHALGLAATVLPPILTGGLTTCALNQLGTFRLRRIDLPLPTLPPDLDGLTILHLTDLHIGQFLPAGMDEEVLRAANGLSTDLVVFTGDLLDVSSTSVDPGLSFIQRLEPRHGLVMIQGNHDGMGRDGAGEFEARAKEARLPLLLDEARSFHIPGRATPIQFLGATWGTLKFGRDMGMRGRNADNRFRDPSAQAAQASMNTLLAARDPGAFPILLAHHPHFFDRAVSHGLPLTLAGHTHGGQLMLTDRLGVGPIRFRYWSGVYARQQSRLVVSNGLGNWFPLRVHAPPEIIHLTLRATVT